MTGYEYAGRAADIGEGCAAVLFGLALAAVIIAADYLAARVALRWHDRRRANCGHRWYGDSGD